MILFTGKKLTQKQEKFVYKKFNEVDMPVGFNVNIDWCKNKGLHWKLTTVIGNITIEKIGKKFYSLITETVNDLKERGF